MNHMERTNLVKDHRETAVLVWVPRGLSTFIGVLGDSPGHSVVSLTMAILYRDKSGI